MIENVDLGVIIAVTGLEHSRSRVSYNLVSKIKSTEGFTEIWTSSSGAVDGSVQFTHGGSLSSRSAAA